ncbi:TraM recognition domain-containing protein, partial [Neptunomonas phycophila]|uniref:TraM recognition domain-containing protein n=2 Tax=Neptunomonas phycophila TaxID=1572645 RepID=UPI00351765C3
MATDQALRPENIVADRRTLTQWYSDACRSPSFRGYLYLVAAFLIFLAPLWTLVIFIFLLPAVFSNRVPDVPLRLPVEANMKDKNDPKPGGEGANMARGSVYLGNEKGSNKEAWLSWNDQRLHDYVMGATGSGKTETILAINANYVLAGSGFLIGDGKGTMMFPKQTTTLARIAGADDDSFVISFLSGYRDHYDRSPLKKSNLINPFGEGNASTVKELLTSLMSDGGGDNAIFADGAASLADSLSPAWVEGRDRGLFDFNISYIAQSLALEKVFKLSQHSGLSELSRSHISNYLSNTGYNFDEPPSKQPENCTRMHGYYVNYFMRVVTSFAISYRHIYLCKQGEVNMRDTVKSRRCLTFTLPPLEKSPDEVQNLGKTLLVSARSASSYGLGETMEGSREETVDKLPANYPVPYKFNFDEFSFYVLEGFSLLPAQLRGINISCLVGAQDYIGTERAGEIDAGSIFANARTKLFGALEDSKTWDKVREIVGEVDMAVYDKLVNMGSVAGRYVPDLDLRLTRRCPLEIRDLQSQVEGEFHVMQRGRVRKIKTYYPNINENTVLDNFQLIRLISVFRPDDEVMAKLKVTKDFISMLCQKEALFHAPGVLTKLSAYKSQEAGDTQALNAMLAYHKEIRFSLNHQPEIKLESDPPAQETSPTPVAAETDISPDEDEVDIPYLSVAQKAAMQESHNNAIDEWDTEMMGDVKTENNPLPSYTSEEIENENSLYNETIRQTSLLYDNKELPTDGIYSLTDNEISHIQKRYQSLGLLLGESQEESESSANEIAS